MIASIAHLFSAITSMAPDWAKGIPIVAAALGWFSGVITEKYRALKKKKKEAEALAETVIDSQQKQFERERSHEERLSNIAGGKFDLDDVSRMLSTYPSDQKTVSPSPHASREGNVREKE